MKEYNGNQADLKVAFQALTKVSTTCKVKATDFAGERPLVTPNYAFDQGGEIAIKTSDCAKAVGDAMTALLSNDVIRDNIKKLLDGNLYKNYSYLEMLLLRDKLAVMDISPEQARRLEIAGKRLRGGMGDREASKEADVAADRKGMLRAMNAAANEYAKQQGLTRQPSGVSHDAVKGAERL